MSRDIPPIEFSTIGLDANSFFLVSPQRGEWHGKCPCAGCRNDPHNNDRFRIFTSRDYPSWWGTCRKCGFNGWVDKLNPAIKRELSDAEKLEWAKRKAQYENDKKLSDEKHHKRQREKLKYFTSGDLIMELHDRMSDAHRKLWRDAGIPDTLQDYYKLGMEISKTFKSKGIDIITDAMTIPYYHYNHEGLDWVFKTMQYRLMNPMNPKDKYRFSSDLESTWFDTYPDMPIPSRVIFTEGFKKGANLFRIMPEKYHDKVKIVAEPSNKSILGIKGIIDKVDRAYIIPDPDSINIARDIAREYGKGKMQVVDLPFKLDDGINSGLIDWDGVESAMRQSRRIR